ncbi:uncharacterized protein LOC113287838 isoform X2 [Papaver somniferum]|uniref:uncharacterized protein LOC113287838 isoform X2 n=1 Tax=Papaver somniferum TaxID=3469 RepID=UPI000E6F70F4|nr:uncharacterized protein LOC113287838 isoform X2 [Papaver somniferum]
MKLLSCNVQGIGTPLTKDHLQYLCQLYNPDIVFLAETKAPLSRMDLFFKKSKFHDWFIIPSVGIAKGLAIAWHNIIDMKLVCLHNNIDMKLVSTKYNVCHFETSLGDEKIFITCVYRAIDTDEKIRQWNYISEMAQQVNKPWALIGDLNIILDPDEKQGENKASSSSKTIIIQTIDFIGLQDAGYEGAPFTWSNNRKGEVNICERIDRALTSFLWSQKFPDAKEPVISSYQFF